MLIRLPQLGERRLKSDYEPPMFEERSGKTISLPSYLLEPIDQMKLIESAGLKVKKYRKIVTGDLNDRILSQKTTVSGNSNGGVIELYVAVK